MRQRLGDLRAGQTALESAAQVHIELVVVAHRGERGDGDQAAIAHTEIGPPPQIIEDYVVGELDELRCDGPQFGAGCSARVPPLRREPEVAELTALRLLVSIFRALYT